MQLTLLIIPGWEMLKRFALGEKKTWIYQCKIKIKMSAKLLYINRLF